MMTSFRRTDDLPPTDRPTLHVTWARLAMLWWRDTQVTVPEQVELTPLDHFALAAVARLGSLDAPAFEEFTGLPRLVFNGLARRLHSLRLLEWRDEVMRPWQDHASVQNGQNAIRSSTISVDLLYLPEIDDLLVIPEGLADWERSGVDPAGAAPLPLGMHKTSFRELVGAKLSAGLIADLPAGVISLADEADEELTAMAGATPRPPVPVCPVFECAATLVLGEQHRRIQVEFIGNSKRRAGRENRVALDLTGASGLAERWSGEVSGLAERRDELDKAMRALGLTEPPHPKLTVDDSGSWWLSVSGRHARVLAETGLLTLPIGLEVRRRHVHATVALRLRPADDEARLLLRRDEALQAVLQDHVMQGEPIDHHDPRVREGGGVTALMARAWHLKYFTVVHAMRENEDFAYV
ncbi:hypothetical protein AB0M47_04225 [Hamadaea sp. NPDC051192]|uniref:hypothetical protein n=1 Tax=Hamadaea sp. NPDC051192 TaxID=3154940 RepID=UPI00341829DE